MMTATSIRTLAALSIAALMLTGCGRAGDPLKPSQSSRLLAKENKQPPPPTPLPNKNNPDKRFILDGLLE
ncbi:MAG: LPS translocon maturation chaperone LptM [Rhizobiaceae bacterium]